MEFTRNTASVIIDPKTEKLMDILKQCNREAAEGLGALPLSEGKLQNQAKLIHDFHAAADTVKLEFVATHLRVPKSGVKTDPNAPAYEREKTDFQSVNTIVAGCVFAVAAQEKAPITPQEEPQIALPHQLAAGLSTGKTLG